jgi:hypothetical protein
MKYFFYEVVLPVLLVVLVYFPGGVTLLHDEPHLFEKVFATGDLFGISLLILISSFVELDKTQLELGRESFGLCRAVSFVSGMFALSTYVLVKVWALHFEYDSEPIAAYITHCAWACIGWLAYTAVLGAFLRLLTAKVRRSTRSVRPGGIQRSTVVTQL